MPSAEELEVGAGKYCLALRSGAQPLGPVLHAYVTIQAPRGGAGPGTMAPAVTALPPSPPPLPFLSHLNCLEFSLVAPLPTSVGDLSLHPYCLGRRSNPRPGGEGELRTVFSP